VRTAPLCLLAAGLLAVPATSASAAGTTVRGGCFVVASRQSTVTHGTYAGVIGAAAVQNGPTGGPATIRCSVRVNGADATPTYTYNGTGVVAGANQISFDAADGASGDLCQSVDGGTPECEPASEAQAPPQEVVDLVHEVSACGPVVCPTLTGYPDPAHVVFALPPVS